MEFMVAKLKLLLEHFKKQMDYKQTGIAGEKTLQAIGISSSGNSGGSNNTASKSSDLNLLSRLVYGEARGEKYEGQVAVAAVVLNRVKSPKFPNTVAGVIYEAGAFDAVSDGQINLSPNKTAKSAAQDALNRLGSIKSEHYTTSIQVQQQAHGYGLGK